MTQEVLHTWSWLNLLTKKRYDALIEICGTLDSALQHIDPELLQAIGIRMDTIMKAMNRLDEFDPEQHAAELEKRSISILSIENDAYPSALADIPDLPIFLSYKGDISLVNQPCIGLVGKRDMSSYGKRVTESFVPPIVRAGCVTVSGLADGIDTVVAEETIKAGGKTIAVLGHGFGTIYPQSSARLAEEIVESGGLVLSEFALDTQPGKYTFPARNRIIAGLSAGTVVLEAAAKSGALITSDLALDYGRDVFAVPGQIFDPNYEGCHAAIAQSKAKLVSSADEVLREIGIVSPQRAAKSEYQPQSDQESIVYKALTTMPQSVSDLVGGSGLRTDEINATLTMMEIVGAAKNVGGGMWVRQ